MFSKIEDVIQHYEKTHDIIVKGAPYSQIQVIESSLGVTLPFSLKQVFLKVDQEMIFRNLIIHDSRLLLLMNKSEFDIPIDISEYLQVAGTDGYFIYAHIKSGAIYADDSADSEPIFHVADSLEEFICLAVTIVEQFPYGEFPNMPYDENNPEKTELEIKAFLDRHGVTQGWKFWRDLAMGWA